MGLYSRTDLIRDQFLSMFSPKNNVFLKNPENFNGNGSQFNSNSTIATRFGDLKSKCIGSRAVIEVLNRKMNGRFNAASQEYKEIDGLFDLKGSNPTLDQAKMFFKVRERSIFN